MLILMRVLTLLQTMRKVINITTECKVMITTIIIIVIVITTTIIIMAGLMGVRSWS